MPLTEEYANLLGRLSPLDRLSEAHRRFLLEQGRIDNLPAGKRLPARNRANWLIYLLEGDINLVAVGKSKERLSSRDELTKVRRLHTLFPESDAEEIEYAQAHTDSRILSIRRQAVEELLKSGYEVVESPLTSAESKLLVEIYQAMQQGTLKLPSMPDIAIHIRQITAREDSGIGDVAKVVKTDPILAGRLIQAANSVAYRGSRSADSVHDAVMRLGFKRSANLATSIALHGAFRCQSKSLMKYMHDNWIFSVEVSALAFIIARHSRKIDPDQALLAGLVHRIGVVPIITYAESIPASDTDILQTLQHLTPVMSGLLLQKWNFDQPFIQAAEEAGNWLRNTEAEADLADIVIAARLYANLRSAQPEPLPDIDTAPVFRKLGFGTLQSDQTLQVLEDAAEEIAAIREFLSA